MNLWPHQVDAVSRVLGAWAEGKRAPLLVMPTGTGKTRVLATVAASFAGRCLGVRILVHRAELVSQTKAAIAKEYVEGRAVMGLGSIEVTTPDQLLASKAKVEPVDLLIVDEAHHYVAREWRKILHAHPGQILGATATPERSDGRAMGDAFDVLIAPLSVREAIARGVLVSATVYAPECDDDAKASRGGLAMHPDEALAQYRDQWKRAIAFCATVEHAEAVAARCNASGLRSDVVHGSLAEDARTRVLERFAAGEIDVVTNVFVLTEGYDDAAVDCVVLARGVTSPGAYLQMVGRALRRSPGKSRAIVVDLAGSVYDSRIGLPDSDRSYSLEGVAIREEGERIRIKQCLVCGAVYEVGPSECVRCGAKHPPPPKPRISRARLAEVNSAAYSAAHRPNPREAYYEELKKRAEANGYKPGWAKFQFKQRYGYWPKETGGA